MNDEDDTPRYAYVFLVFFTHRGVHLDGVLDMSPMLGRDVRSYNELVHAANLVAVSAGHKAGVLPSIEEVSRVVSNMRMRARVTDRSGPFLVKTPEPLDLDGLENLLIAYEKRGTLESFLHAARF